MLLPAWFSWKTAAAVLVTLLALAVPVALLVAWLGLYNIAASRGHPAWMNWFLELGMRRSIEVHAKPEPHPDLDDFALISLGAAHYQGGCFPCHAGPGAPLNPVFLGMLPSPPRLETQAPTWKTEELHWIVEHGLQYAGMPGWSGNTRKDEVWAVVAFLRRLPALDPQGYRQLTSGNTDVPEGPIDEIVAQGVPFLRRTACDRCHDTADRPPVSNLVPRLGSQSSQYLYRSLSEYHADIRQSGIMEPVASALDKTGMRELANYYAGLQSPPHAAPPASPDMIERGRLLAEAGGAEGALPACNACHAPPARGSFPQLAGQPAAYIRAQLNLFQRGGRKGSAYAVVMTEIASRLNSQQIEDVAAYFQSLSPHSPAHGVPP